MANADGVSFDVSSPWGSASLRSRLVGKFNASNLLGSLTTLLASDVALQNAVSALQRVPPPRGRMQKIGDGKQALVLVDYAHTPDALEKALSALRELLATGTRSKAGKARAHRLGNPKLICVFGCGGDRDSGKRPLMGAVASRLADAIVITTDNPRGEAPASIIDDILEGVKSSCHVIEDRATAIQFAVNSARTGDIVLIAGKGHEEYQEVMGKKFPFSDIKVAEAVLVAAGNRSQWK